MTDLASHHFDTLLPHRPMLRVSDLRGATGLSDSAIERAIDIGQIKTLRFNTGDGKRSTLLIRRENAILWMLQMMDYEPEEYLAGLVNLLTKLSLPELRIVQARLPELISGAENMRTLPCKLAHAKSAPSRS